MNKIIIALLLSTCAYATQPLITGTTAGDGISDERTDSSSLFLGYKIHVGSGAITVGRLGALKQSLGAGTHTVKLVTASTGVDVTGGSVSVNLTGATSATYVWGSLGSSVTLPANTDYLVLISMVPTSQYFIDLSTPTYTNTNVTISNGVYCDGSPTLTCHDLGSTGQAFGLPNIEYDLASGPPPTITMTAPAPAATISGSSVTVSATASPAIGGPTITNVAFKLDGGTTICTDTTSPYSCVLNTLPLTAGAHTLSATALQSDSVTATAANITVTVANPPSGSVTAPSSGATLSGTITQTASGTAVSGRTVATIQLYIDGGIFSVSCSASPCSKSVDTTMLSNGSHTFTAYILDNAGEFIFTAGITATVNNVAVSASRLVNGDTKYSGVQDLSLGAKLIPPNSGTTPAGACSSGEFKLKIPATGKPAVSACVNGSFASAEAATAVALSTAPTPCTPPAVAYALDVSTNAFLCTTPSGGGGGGGSGASQTSQLTDFALPPKDITNKTLTVSSACVSGASCDTDVAGNSIPLAGGPYTCTISGSSSGTVCAYIDTLGALNLAVPSSLGSTVSCSTGMTVVPAQATCPTYNVKKLWTFDAVSGSWTSGVRRWALSYIKPSLTCGTGLTCTPGPTDLAAIDTGSVLRKFICVGGPSSSLPSGATEGDVCWDMDGAAGSVAGKWVCNRALGCTVAGDWKTY